MELLLLAIPVAVLAAAVFAFKRFWPAAPDPTSSPTSSLLSGPRQLTTGQIARGVFWGMWLFWLSQIIVGAVAMFLVLGLTGAMVRNAFGG